MKKFILALWLSLALVLSGIGQSGFAFPAQEVKFLLDREYVPAVITLLRGAKQSIQMMMFEASYYPGHPKSPSNQLIEELIAACKRGVSVEVILETSEDSTERTTTRNIETARMLKRGGVDITLDPKEITTHTKLLIIDTATVVMGSTNWTYPALTRNHEANVMLSSPEGARLLQSYFQKIKKSGTKF